MKYILFVVSFLFITHVMAYCQINQGVIIGTQLAIYKTAEDSCRTIITTKEGIANDINTELLADSASNAFYIVDIISSCNNRFLVNVMSSDMDSMPFSMDSVWISNKNVGIGLTPTKINDESRIPLYDKPSNKSNYSLLPKDVAYSIAQIIECHGKWQKVRLRNKGNEIIGWLAPENQCVNMYSMCCGN